MLQKWFRDISLRSKMTIPVMLILLLLYLSFNVATYISVISTEKENIVARSYILGEGVAINLKAALMFDDGVSGKEILDAFQADNLVSSVRVIRKDGSIFAAYQRAMEKQHLSVEYDDFEHLSPDLPDHMFSKRALHLSIPVTVDNAVLADMQINVSLRSLEQTKLELIQVGLMMLVPLLMISSLLVRLLQVWVVGPVQQLSQAMQDIVHYREENMRPAVNSNDEIGSLVNCFNGMLDDLDLRDGKISKALEQLAKEKKFAEDVISSVQHALVVLDQQDDVVMVNNACSELFFPVAGKLKGEKFASVIHPAIWQKCENYLVGMDNREDFESFVEIQANGGQSKFYMVMAKPVVHREQLLLAIEDVTQKYIAAQQQRLAARIYEQSRDGIIVANINGEIQMLNHALCTMMGCQENELVNTSIGQLMNFEHFSTIRDALLQGAGDWQGEVYETRGDNESIPLAIKANLIGGEKDNEQQIVMSVSDLSEVKEIERLDYLAHHDSLTGLANRTRLLAVLEEAISVDSTDSEANLPFAVLYLDLDGFKLVNDTFGHDAGDLVLKTVSERLKQSTRKNDLVARLAGDEFVVLLNPVTDSEEGRQVAERILEGICQPIPFNDVDLFVSASIGYNLVKRGQSMTIDQVLKEADSAMYKAKSAGRQGIYYVGEDNSI